MIDGGKPAVYERILGRKAGKMIWSGAPRACIDTLHKQKNAGPRFGKRNPAFLIDQQTGSQP
ncbi:hypothetical protein PQR68_17090 [Paraburkholderia agricolaris]|uniref:Uncharacterized protein n=1 Tax=Paraburkholderia agricolaris TaxID=2152888 RepID=A0ABW8ZYZ4_9BURK